MGESKMSKNYLIILVVDDAAVTISRRYLMSQEKHAGALKNVFVKPQNKRRF